MAVPTASGEALNLARVASAGFCWRRGELYDVGRRAPSSVLQNIQFLIEGYLGVTRVRRAQSGIEHALARRQSRLGRVHQTESLSCARWVAVNLI